MTGYYSSAITITLCFGDINTEKFTKTFDDMITKPFTAETMVHEQ